MYSMSKLLAVLWRRVISMWPCHQQFLSRIHLDRPRQDPYQHLQRTNQFCMAKYLSLSIFRSVEKEETVQMKIKNIVLTNAAESVMRDQRSWLKRSSQLGALMLAVALTGCSTYRPWINEIADLKKNVETDQAPIVAPVSARTPASRATPPVVAAVTLSGGGARAAAFGLGVLRELKATQFKVAGQATTLLDQVGLISGVSGGSILAGHYAVFGDETLTRFEPDFLLASFQDDLITQLFAPQLLHRLTSPWYGRSHILQKRLDDLYGSRTFRDIKARPNAPDLIVTATDLTTGAPFEFTREQFKLICSDLDSTPLSFAIAASSAVPILLSPMTLKNHAGKCAPTAKATNSAIRPPERAAGAGFRARMLEFSAESYRDAEERPFIHLVDGGVSDNTGARLIIDRLFAGGSIASAFPDAPAGSIRRMILITVNSERGLEQRIDSSDTTPSTGQVIETLVFGAGARGTQFTFEMLSDDARRWQKELLSSRGKPGSPFAADAELHIINVSLSDVPDDKIRRSLLRVPTAFTIQADDVKALQRAGADTLRETPAFMLMKNGLSKLEKLP